MKTGDSELIDGLGGPTQLAKRLGFDLKKGGVQRVANWRTRGIPPRVLLDHAEVFRRQPPAANDTQGQGPEQGALRGAA